MGPGLGPHREPAGGVEGRRDRAAVEGGDFGIAHVLRAVRQLDPNQSVLDLKATQTEELVERDVRFEDLGESFGVVGGDLEVESSMCSPVAHAHEGEIER